MPKGLERYGITWDVAEPLNRFDAASIELAMVYRNEYWKANGFLGRYQHLHNAIDLIWNEPRRSFAFQNKTPYDERKHDAYIWNDWTERAIEALCEWKWATTFTGPNASWKTTSAAIYGVSGFFASPSNTIVVITSTTMPGIRKRIFKEICRYHASSRLGIGQLNTTDLAIRFTKGSDAAGIFGVATGQTEGEVETAVNKIIGFHATNVIVIVDEMQATNEAIVKACVSLEAGSERFQFIGLGNADSELDAHGQMCEPAEGWSSIDDQAEQWETKRGICVHFDGLESPRVKEGDEFYPGLLKQADLDSTIRDYGEDSPEWWSKRRGFWAPQGVSKAIFSTADIIKFKARAAPIWIGEYTQGLALDPAYEGGDRCILRRIGCGKITSGETVIAPMSNPIVIKVKVSIPDDPIHFQIAKQVKDIADEFHIPPHMIALDSTGEGGGLHSIMVREIGAGILAVEFGGTATNEPVSATNKKPGNQEYYNRATQLWYFLRTVLRNNQLRGLDADTAKELCKRPKKNTGGRIQMVPKSELPGKSPDLADALVVGAQLFHHAGLLTVKEQAAEGVPTANEQWRDFARRHDVTSDYLVA